MSKTHPLTSAEKARRRVNMLNYIARLNGFETWRIMETDFLNQHEETKAQLVLPARAILKELERSVPHAP